MKEKYPHLEISFANTVENNEVPITLREELVFDLINSENITHRSVQLADLLNIPPPSTSGQRSKEVEMPNTISKKTNY